MIIRPSQNHKLTTDIQSNILHSVRPVLFRREEATSGHSRKYFILVRPDISRKIQEHSLNTFYSVHPDISITIKSSIPFLTRIEMKGWSDPPSHRLPVHNEIQTGLDSLGRPPVDPAQRQVDVGRKLSLRPRIPDQIELQTD